MASIIRTITYTLEILEWPFYPDQKLIECIHDAVTCKEERANTDACRLTFSASSPLSPIPLTIPIGECAFPCKRRACKWIVWWGTCVMYEQTRLYVCI